jgi:HAD superfamily hydrolase (TIGR01509 family)
MAPSAAAPRAVLFDLDGTLIDTYRLYLESFRRALEPALGFAPSDAEILARKPVAERRLLRDWLGEEQAAEAHQRFGEHYARLYPALADGVYDGVREMLAALRSAGYPLGIVTGKGRQAWLATEGPAGLGVFAVVVTDDDVAAPKPDPQGLWAAAAALGLEPAQVLYVGDSIGDLRAARAAGMLAAAVLWPKTAPGEAERFVKQIESFTPEWVFAHPAELTRVLAGWC